MHAPTLLLPLTTLLIHLTTALPSTPLIPNLITNPNPGCQRIHAHALSRRLLSETADSTTDSTIDTAATAAAAVPNAILAPRDSPGTYNPCGILRGGERSNAFTLNHDFLWSAYWVDDRTVPGARVLLWELGGSDDHMLQSAPMHLRHILTPFTPVARRQYALELRGAPSAMVSWYFATQ